jgi:hypothetical protein
MDLALRIEVFNGKKNICYCIFGVYLVTGTKYPDISQERTFRISMPLINSTDYIADLRRSF